MISSGPSLSIEESVHGVPAESAKVKSSANAPTRSFCPSFKRLPCKRIAAAPSPALSYIVISTEFALSTRALPAGTQRPAVAFVAPGFSTGISPLFLM